MRPADRIVMSAHGVRHTIANSDTTFAGGELDGAGWEGFTVWILNSLRRIAVSYCVDRQKARPDPVVYYCVDRQKARPDPVVYDPVV